MQGRLSLVGDVMFPSSGAGSKAAAAKPWDQTVKDDKGRRRFHGAFTGGFSAGYFNTVGSAEGWTPATFVSSRKQKATASLPQRRPEDYMDAEDLQDFAQAGVTIVVRPEFSAALPSVSSRSTETESAVRTKTRATDLLFDDSVPSASQVVANVERFGMKILRKLGYGSSKKSAGSKGVRKVGPFFPGELSEETAEVAVSSSFYIPSPKNDVFGIGYIGTSDDLVFAREKATLKGDSAGKQLRLGSIFQGESTRQSSFGIGALEDDDDMDVYDSGTALSSKVFNHNKEPVEPSDSSVNKSNMSSHKIYFGDSQEKCSDGTPVLTGFVSSQSSPKMSSKLKLESSSRYGPNLLFEKLEVPQDFQEQHIFPEDEMLQLEIVGLSTHLKKEAHERRKRAFSRWDSESKFNTFKNAIPVGPDFSSIEAKTRESAALSSHFRVGSVQSFFQGVSLQSHAPGLNEVVRFKPFEGDPEKQIRFEKFCKSSETERETIARNQTEYVEFQKIFEASASNHKPVNEEEKKPINLRDLPQSFDDAARKGFYGKLTREELIWNPAKLLCKRFKLEVPNPSALTDIEKSAEPNRKLEEPLTDVNAVPAQDSEVAKQEKQDHQGPDEIVDTEPKPSLDLFKAIFDDDDSSDDDLYPTTDTPQSAAQTIPAQAANFVESILESPSSHPLPSPPRKRISEESQNPPKRKRRRWDVT